MGLRDIIQGLKNGPRGQRQPRNSGSGGGMSPVMVALLSLLAYIGLKRSRGQATPTDSDNSSGRTPPPRRWL